MKNILRYPLLLGSVLAALVVSATVQPARAQVMDRILKDRSIKIGYIPSPPGTIKDPASGEVKGYYVDGVRYIFKAIGVEPVFVETTWANFAAGLQSGQFDLSIAGTFATIQRAAAVEFTKPIHYLGYSAIVKKGDARFKVPSDFNKEGLKIAVVQGGAAQEYVKENFPNATVVALGTGNLTAPFMEVSAGRAEVGIEDAWQARRYASQQPGVTDLFQDNPYNLLPIAWTVKRGNQDLLNFTNTAIDFMLLTGRWERMANAYGMTGRFYDRPSLMAFGTVTEAPTTDKK
ncbi:amino acid ABC transporter substrate-binding protein [Xanthobacter dioxanivorans]|uniref:Amino acid ABC transporter substrate-binding protein n=1 Tax=Xanthobacter dioxanivorans TaxID=2528964 RepID=A0A974PRR6_9HYPH|nr:ABC transporter substrate-binding protein [Xanthobacter dioxanivorans]QRG08475.1 amino acid ABC transporter substrate-binding protein [Xanthobacter dioxanivorans]